MQKCQSTPLIKLVFIPGRDKVFGTNKKFGMTFYYQLKFIKHRLIKTHSVHTNARAKTAIHCKQNTMYMFLKDSNNLESVTI